MRPYVYLLALALVSLAYPLLAQSDLVVLTGRVVDAETRRAVPYAHVGIPARGIGTTSGYDGSFELKLPPGLGAERLMVSCIGYDTYARALPTSGAAGTIALSPSLTGLTEVVVMDREAVLNILRRAVAAIPDNYPDRPTRTQAFYRESLTDDSLRYKYLAEGVLQVYQPSYTNGREGQVGLVQGRKVNLLDPLDTAFNSGFTSGHMAALRFDFVKNREDFIDEAYFPVYRYRLDGMTTYDGAPVYVIAFEPEPEARSTALAGRRRGLLKLLDLLESEAKDEPVRVEARLAGRVYIDKTSLAFVRAEFEVTPEGLGRYNDYPLYSGQWRANRYTVNYRRHGGRWTFSDALREGERRHGAHYVNEVKTTEIDETPAQQIPYPERLEREREFVGLTGRYAEDFWRAYNITPMSEGLAAGMRQYETMRKAQAVFSEGFRDSVYQVRALAAAREAALREAATADTPGGRSEDSSAGSEGDTSERATGVELIDAPVSSPTSVQRTGVNFRMALGVGPHLLSSGPVALAIDYRDAVGNPMVALGEQTLDRRTFEPLIRWDIDLLLNRYAFVRYGTTYDLGRGRHKDRALGLGLEANLRPRHRPIVVRGIAQYSNLQYYRALGTADVADTPFRVNRKRFKGDEVRLGYGSSRHGFNLAAELAVELRSTRALYARATYHRSLRERAGVWFKETDQTFRKDARVPVGHERLRVRSADADFAGLIAPTTTWSFAVGLLFL